MPSSCPDTKIRIHRSPLQKLSIFRIKDEDLDVIGAALQPWKPVHPPPCQFCYHTASKTCFKSKNGWCYTTQPFRYSICNTLPTFNHYPMTHTLECKVSQSRHIFSYSVYLPW